MYNYSQFNGTALARIQRPSNKPICLQKTNNASLTIGKQTTEFIGNAVATSITDVPAGTNVDVYFKTFGNSKATGSAVYSGSYGNSNFVAEKQARSDSEYTGGWKISELKACVD